MRGERISDANWSDDGSHLGPFTSGNRCSDGTLTGSFITIFASGVWLDGTWDLNVWSEAVW